MTGKHHSIAGLCAAACITTSVVASQDINIVPMLLLIGVTYVGGLFPDIDTKTSIISKKMKLTSKILSSLFGHRGFLHSPLFVFMMTLIGWLIFKHYNIMDYFYIYLGFTVGMLMHLTCDMATKGGLPLMYPYTRKRFSISVLESGSKWEPITLTFICVLAAIVTGLCIFKGWYINCIL